MGTSQQQAPMVDQGNGVQQICVYYAKCDEAIRLRVREDTPAELAEKLSVARESYFSTCNINEQGNQRTRNFIPTDQ